MSGLIHAPASTPTAPAALNLRLATGMMGVLTAVLVAGVNEHVTEIGLTDIAGQMHLGHDDATWMTALFEAFNITAMAFAPWFGATFSIRYLTMTMTAVAGLLGLAAPFMPDLVSLLLLRCVQGLACGCLPLTGMMFEGFGWRFLFWDIVPLCALAITAVGWGLPQDPLRLDRFRQFDWRGVVTGVPGIVMLVIALEQGDRLDWFRSPVITHLVFGGGFLFTLFMINEWHHPLPFFRASLLKNRNVSASLITLAGALVLAAVTTEIPFEYLTEVRHYRPIQMLPMGLLLAVPQLLALPLSAALLNIRTVDARHVLAGALLVQGTSYYLCTWLDADWVRENFYPVMMLQVASQPLMVLADLVIVTLGLGPADGPFISGLFNVTKGLANAIAAALVDVVMRRREQYHSTMLLDHYGEQGAALNGMDEPATTLLGPHTVDPDALGGTGLHLFHEALSRQATILACVDIYIIMIGVCAVLAVVNLVLPRRVYPPRAA
ncbi:EmrB/QacA family drug resistance transporter [Asaia lannensis]|uniref:EmrB/QacA family drug resistance transporter n=1 Tax=Asaia lannensis TaxID=415421 RepID=UPI0038737D24